MSINPAARTIATQPRYRDNKEPLEKESHAAPIQKPTHNVGGKNPDQDSRSVLTALTHFEWVSNQACTEFFIDKLQTREKFKTQSILAHVDSLEAIHLTDDALIKNAVFTDGTKAGLINTDNTSVLFVQYNDGKTSYFQVGADGTVGSRIRSGDISEVLTSESASALWKNPTLLNVSDAVGTEPTLDEAYDFYSNTAEGKLILDREESYYRARLVNDDTKALFITRVKYNSGEGGIELFADFMPNRTALLNDPVALKAYDEQYQLIFSEIKNESRIGETGLPLDPSLQIIVASGLAEALAQSPERVNEVLTDIDSGWTVQYENGVNGEYNVSKFPSKSAKASICFKLDALLYGYASPDDTYNVIAHEIAHSLDAQGSINLDGLPSLSHIDTAVLNTIRIHLASIYYASPNPKNPETFGLDPYAFKNTAEFWADISMYFLSSDNGANIINDISPDLYDVLSRYYNSDPLEIAQTS